MFNYTFTISSEPYETIYAGKYFSDMYPLGYAICNLLSCDLKQLEFIMNNFTKFKAKEEYTYIEYNGEKVKTRMLGIGCADDLYFFNIPIIEKEYNNNKKQFESVLLLIKTYFDIINQYNEEPDIDNLLYFLSINRLRIPCFGSNNNCSKENSIDYREYEEITFENFNENKENIGIYYSLRDKNENDVYSTTYVCNDFLDICISSLHFILSNGYSIRQCENCGKYYIPYNRSDTLYCDRASPQVENKTCKEYGAFKTYQDNLKINEAMGLYRKIYMQKQMLAKRNPDIDTYKNEFEEFKKESKQWKEDIKKGAKNELDYLEWLKSIKNKRG